MVTSIVETITQAFTGLLGGLGSGIVGFFDDVVMAPEGGGISNFATWALVFLGVSFAIFIVRKITGRVM